MVARHPGTPLSQGNARMPSSMATATSKRLMVERPAGRRAGLPNYVAGVPMLHARNLVVVLFVPAAAAAAAVVAVAAIVVFSIQSSSA